MGMGAGKIYLTFNLQNPTSRIILISISMAKTMANSWRMSGDVYDSFSRPDARCPCTGDEEGYLCVLPGFHCSILNIMNKMAKIASKTQSGAQNDMDGLEVGNGGMTDNEYITQMSIWAINSSPLLMGNDVTNMTPATISILSNPAVLAISQDPMTQAATRTWRYAVADKDEYGMGEINLWTRMLNNTDVVVALVNGGNKTREMNATLADIFLDQGADRSTEAQTGYDVYDLWGYRMDNATASAVLHGNATISSNSTMRYNATSMSYAEGIKNNVTALMGKKIGSVDPLGRLTAKVPRHGTGLFRLRANGKTMMKRDEL
ncbi:MAG: alpha-galactosidase [Janthinobacterium lividum]